MTAPSYRVWALRGLPEVRPGDDLAKLIAAGEPGLVDGDVLLVTSKIVSKAEGRIVEAGDREAAIDAETVRVVARRGALRIVENRQGLVMAAAGVDASNTPAGTVLLLPEDPDASAARIREGLRDALGVEVGVVITDTFGRPWRAGLTRGPRRAAGRPVLDRQRGGPDAHGNPRDRT
ncbi:coenzyme F420-0:L-glutamate ligase, partial [Streptomyces sp. NPDC058991]|uniref:coenzyme F420-0:L-glutamate ligase n=1 Tax=Streptomyces sp. NPDC058991 TaxID=3346687 RepID=UPI0036A1ED68